MSTPQDYKGKYLVLFFYPLDFTFVCPTEIIAFSDRSVELVLLSGPYPFWPINGAWYPRRTRTSFTFCNIQRTFPSRVEEFRKIGCEVVAASTDSHFSHLAWINTPRKQGGLGNMKIPLLADKTCDIAKRSDGWAGADAFVTSGYNDIKIILVFPLE